MWSLFLYWTQYEVCKKDYGVACLLSKVKFITAYDYLNPTWELHRYGASPELHHYVKETSIIVWFSKVSRCLFETIYVSIDKVDEYVFYQV